MFNRSKKAIALVMSLFVTASGLAVPQKVEAEESGKTEVTENTYYQYDSFPRVESHDPSIVRNNGKYGAGATEASKHKYYVFGSHLQFAYSDDLVHWTRFENNLWTDYETEFAVGKQWSALGSSSYSLMDKNMNGGNLWAPDVIWNETMQKWCMYMSVNGPDWNSTICLLTADTLDGDWHYINTVVYSGFGKDDQDWTKTDYETVTGDAELPARYLDVNAKSGNKQNGFPGGPNDWNTNYGAHAIDPCVYYDEEGELRFVYGSWSGGIWTFKLDKETGLRDTTVKYSYDTTAHSDPYMGKQIGGGQFVSGEAPYIQHIGEYYYLFISYGGFTANGGYNMRVFRSKSPEGPFLDAAGNNAIFDKWMNNINGAVGTRLMSYYKWSYWENAQAAQGHNSAFTDEDGKSYVVYHTRSNDGTEVHKIRVHQLFTTESGFLAAAPFEHRETDVVREGGYSKEEIAGSYEILLHASDFNYEKLEYVSPKSITLGTDGKVSGDLEGTWEHTDGTAVLKIKIGETTYEGCLVDQTMEGLNLSTLCFTSVGTDNLCLWGYKYPEGGAAVFMDKERLKITSVTSEDITLPTQGVWGSTITWESDNAALTNTGKVTVGDEAVAVRLTATITSGDYYATKSFTVQVVDKSKQAYQVGETLFADKPLNPSEGVYSIANPLLGQDISNGVTIKLNVKRLGAFANLTNGNIFAFDMFGKEQYNEENGGSSEGKAMWFMDGAYLGYNVNTGNNQFFDGNGWSSINDYLTTGENVAIEIKLLPNGYEVWLDGVLCFNRAMVKAGTVYGSDNLPDYREMLTWLSNEATNINFGFGTWPGWAGAFNGEISNFQIWANPVGTVKIPEGYYYYETYQDYSIDLERIWGSIGAGKDFETEGENTFIAFTPGNASKLGAISTPELTGTISGIYRIDTDVKLISSSNSSQVTEFDIGGEDLDFVNNYNTAAESGYLLKLSASGSNNQVFKINDTSDSVTLPKNWVRISVLANTANRKYVRLTITDLVTNKKLIDNRLVSVNGEGVFSKLHMLVGTGDGKAAIDNTAIYKSSEKWSITTTTTTTTAKKNTITAKNFTKTAKTKTQTFSIGAKATGGKLTYKSDNKKITVSSAGKVTIAKSCVGKATITITASGSGYQTATKKITVTVNPAKPTLKLKAKSKGFTATWGAAAGAGGYEVQYSTSKKFKSKTTKKLTKKTLTVKKLKKKTTYYVRIRTYKKVSGKTYTSAWSKVVKVKTKK